ncbi:hypothetical protein BGX26_012887 [Mortierella sp. AD094]|nr:hypothetical protein BGX26_012887 [Mortierella sp. AD094]
MYLSRSHTEKGVSSGAMLKKDIRRRRRGQGSPEPRPISEPPLAREPTLLSDRAEELHRSKTSLNKLLDSVMDNATALTESNSRQMYHHSSDDSHIPLDNSPSTKASRTSATPPTSTVLPAKRPSTTRNHSSKATFFVCEDDSEEEEDEEEEEEEEDEDEEDEDEEDELEQENQHFKAPHFIKVRSSMEFIDYCHGDFQAFEQLGEDEDIDKDDYFGKTALLKHHQAPIHTSVSTLLSDTPGMGRRQSLLSDLFMAEKLLAAQRASSGKAVNNNTTTWARPPLYPNPPLSRHGATSPEGDDLFSAAVSPQQIIRSTQLKAQPTSQTLVGLAHQSIQSSHHQYQHFGDRIFMQEELASPKVMAGHERTPKSPLKRTKKSMFKNLDELAVDTTTDVQEADATEHSILQSQQPGLTPTNLAPASALAYEISDCKTALVTLSPAFIPTPASPSPSPLKSSKNLPPHSTLPSPVKACRCSPATATTKTAFATVSATTSPVFSAVTAAAAVAATTGIGGDNFSSWTQIHHFQTHLQSFCEHLSSSIQRAISTPSAT